MKSLFTYLNEAKGYLDYTDFIKDIKKQIAEHIKDYIFDKYNEAVEKYKNSSISPKLPPIMPDVSFVVNSKNYPSWLNSLTIQDFSHIKGYNSYSFEGTSACVDTDLINAENKTATIFVNPKLFLQDRGNNYSYLDEKLKNCEKISKSDIIVDISNNQDFDETMVHELKHIFDFIIHNKLDSTFKKLFDTNSTLDDYEKEKSGKSNLCNTLINCISQLKYFFNKLELSAYQQEIMFNAINNPEEYKQHIEKYLNVINSRNIKTFFKETFNEIGISELDIVFDGTRFFDYIYTISYISRIYQMDIENDETTNAYELNSIVKNSGVSKILFNKDYKGKTYKDFRNFLIKAYNKTIQDIKKILIKAAKNV
jgi:hypothetical protein